MVRQPIVSGMFYEDNPTKLKEQIELAFLDEKFGPGTIPKANQHNHEIYSIISPHAGYFFSAACAAHAYKFIAESKNHPDVFIILAPNHSGMGMTSLIKENYATPFGEITTNKIAIEPGAVFNGTCSMGKNISSNTVEK